MQKHTLWYRNIQWTYTGMLQKPHEWYSGQDKILSYADKEHVLHWIRRRCLKIFCFATLDRSLRSFLWLPCMWVLDKKLSCFFDVQFNFNSFQFKNSVQKENVYFVRINWRINKILRRRYNEIMSKDLTLSCTVVEEDLNWNEI